MERAAGWPPFSPGSVNAWLLLVTTKPATWQDPLVSWADHPPTLGEANESFFYPDPLGFWAEVRRWSLELLRVGYPDFGTPEALAVTTLLHMGDDRARFERISALCAPRTILFLDEASWSASGLDVHAVPHHIADPHRPRQVYEGFWGRDADGRAVGRTPQHPAANKLYRAADMSGFLRAAPAPRTAADQA